MSKMGWNHIIIEGFCAKDWDYNQKSSEFNYKFDKDKDAKDWEKVPNPKYDPNAVKTEWPEYCKKHICYVCYDKDCPHLATAPGRMKDVIWANKRRKKAKNKKKGKK